MYGSALLAAQKANIPTETWLAATRSVINSLRRMDQQNALNQYSMDEALTIPDAVIDGRTLERSPKGFSTL